MSSSPHVTRRLLLRQVGTGASVFGTYLLPSWVGTADAAPRHHWHPRHDTPTYTGRRPPKPLIMLDPGHGGRDPGAIGVTGIYEKNIALAAAHELHRLILREGHYRVALTRWRDVFIPLEQRVEIARHHGAALFVSMHADALPHNHTVRGASVYTMASTASDPEAAAIAASENSADRFVGRKYRAVSPTVARILASLVRRETRLHSATLADKMVDSLDRAVAMLPNPDRHAGFVVLQSAEIPSVLVEMGFMSNRRDEEALRRPAHRALVARAMKQAVDGYFAGVRRADAEMAG